ncbi:glutaredoxin family protein [Paenibacillus sp. GSMTC-2017]|uniref:glutaredoxin family protein n=1 Tax=Paenibacillus sp. GSMTC-2017 TaxID=2794350 RepID=UPI0018D8031C|nr:glutaredoxin family protein [Paenibacillus sp. GSMTC-2017]MBH5317865.1 glutaredoxin family protein [Paenibacillus sp. GSMTC-2017]
MKKIEVYTTPTCEDCKNFKKFLNDHNISYTDYDIADHPQHADTLRKRSGKNLVPTIFIDDKIYFGFVFNRQEIEGLLLT